LDVIDRVPEAWGGDLGKVMTYEEGEEEERGTGRGVTDKYHHRSFGKRERKVGE